MEKPLFLEDYVKDLTSGNEGSLIVKFAIPMLLGNVFQQLYNTVDSIIVGNVVGKEALAAVGASFPIMFLLLSLIMGVTMGATILISQYFGAKDYEKLKKTLDTTYIFLFFGSIAISILGVLLSGPILRLMNTPQDIVGQAQTYLNIIFAGMLTLFGYNAIGAILRGLGDSKTPLYFIIIATLLNIVLDLVFVMTFGWGIAGVAWATIISQGVSFLSGILYLNKNHDFLGIKLKGMRFDGEIFKKSLRIGLPAGVQQMLFSLGMMALQFLVNGFGTNTVAGFIAATRVDTFASMPIFSFGAAISAFAGQNLGAGKMERVRRGHRVTLLVSVSLAFITAIFIFLFGGFMIRLFNSDPEVVRIGSNYLKIVSAFYGVVAWMFITTGVMRGAGDTFVPMIISILSLWLIRVPLAAIFSGFMGESGIWWSIPVAWSVGLILTLIYYRTGRWKSKVVVKNVRMDEN